MFHWLSVCFNIIVDIIRTLQVEPGVCVDELFINRRIVHTAESLVECQSFVGLQIGHYLLHIAVDDELQLFFCDAHAIVPP